MARKPQQRAIETRSKLLDVGVALAQERGFDALRVEEIVLKAGVSKGTFFARFTDKDGFMSELIGAQLNARLEELEAKPVPPSVEGIVRALAPLHDFMTCERYVFDIIIRYSGAAKIEAIGPIALSFGRYEYLVSKWVGSGYYRRDINPHLMAEGIQAFAVQAMALEFCALHDTEGRDARLTRYLRAWLTPGEGV